MQKKPSGGIAISLIAILIFGILIFGAYILYQRSIIARFSKERDTQIADRNKTEIVTLQRLLFPDKKIELVHSCVGEIRHPSTYGASPSMYCVGKNILSIVIDDIPTEIITEDAAQDDGAPTLMRSAEFVDSNHVLILYKPDPCRFDSYCEPYSWAGYNFVLDLSDKKLRKISNYPVGSNNIVWNKPQTKALVISSTCVEGGCGEAPVSGYDLTSDTITRLTAEIASEPNGDNKAFWDDVKWSSSNEFTATLVSPSGKEKIITGSF